jgi:hypothetical protein
MVAAVVREAAMASGDDEVRVAVDVWPEEADALAAEVGQEGGAVLGRQTAAPDPGRSGMVEPVGLVIAVTLSWLVARIVERWLREDEAGVLIDLRRSPALVSRVSRVPKGFVLVIDRDGKAGQPILAADDPGGFAGLLGAALGTGG